MSIAQKIWDYRLKEMMGFLNLNHYGTVGNAISMIANELNEDSKLNLKINAIIKRLDHYEELLLGLPYNVNQRYAIEYATPDTLPIIFNILTAPWF